MSEEMKSGIIEPEIQLSQQEIAHFKAMWESRYIGTEIQFLGDVQRLVLKPGDILVFRLPQGVRMTMMSHERLKATWKRILPEHEVMILEDGMEIGIVEASSETTSD